MIQTVITPTRPSPSALTRRMTVAVAVAVAVIAAPTPAVMPALVLFNMLVAAISLVDITELKVPNRILGPGFLMAILLLAGASAFTSEWDRLGRAGAIAALMFAAFLALAALAPSSLGLGDVKLAPYLALHLAWLDPRACWWGFLIGVVLAGAWSAGALRRASDTKVMVPYAPFLGAGALAAELLARIAL